MGVVVLILRLEKCVFYFEFLCLLFIVEFGNVEVGLFVVGWLVVELVVVVVVVLRWVF